jgi:hypothetical protein
MTSAPSMAGMTSASWAKVSRSRSRKVRGGSSWKVCTPEIYGIPEVRGQRFDLVSRPPFPVEQHAPMAGAADEPFPAPRVAEPERSTPDVARREDDAAPRTGRLLTASSCLADRTLLVGRVLAGVGQCFSVPGLPVPGSRVPGLPVSSNARTSTGMGTACRMM